MSNEFAPPPEMETATSDVWQDGFDDFFKKGGFSSEAEKKKSPRIEVGINLTDLGNAKRLVSEHGGDIRYCYPWGKWLIWNGQYWQEDTLGEIYRKAKDVIRLILREASNEKDDKRRKELECYSLRCESQNKLSAMIKLAESEVPILPKDFDRDPWLFNVGNGTLYLLDGSLQHHDREDFITKVSPIDFDPDALCPAWIEHLNKIFAGNQNLIGFHQRWSGYCLTGSIDERKLLIQHGGGANGKTVTTGTIATVLGDYALRTPAETLLIKRDGSIPNDVAALKGVRFVYCSEAEQDKRLAESLVKDLTGGDTISARFMRGEWFQFKPTFKIILSTNHRPIIRGTDQGIWDRIRLLPFTVRIPEEERRPQDEMLARFKDESDGILTWMAKGCLEWIRSGLNCPDEVKAATQGYREEMDFLGDFILDCCVEGKDESVTSKILYEKFRDWSLSEGYKEKDILSRNALGRRLSERGFVRDRTGKERKWHGIGLI